MPARKRVFEKEAGGGIGERTRSSLRSEVQQKRCL